MSEISTTRKIDLTLESIIFVSFTCHLVHLFYLKQKLEIINRILPPIFHVNDYNSHQSDNHSESVFSLASSKFHDYIYNNVHLVVTEAIYHIFVNWLRGCIDKGE